MAIVIWGLQPAAPRTPTLPFPHADLPAGETRLGLGSIIWFGGSLSGLGFSGLGVYCLVWGFTVFALAGMTLGVSVLGNRPKVSPPGTRHQGLGPSQDRQTDRARKGGEAASVSRVSWGAPALLA